MLDGIEDQVMEMWESRDGIWTAGRRHGDDGILVEIDNQKDRWGFEAEMRWVSDDLTLKHSIMYHFMDKRFEAYSDDIKLWLGSEEFSDRMPDNPAPEIISTPGVSPWREHFHLPSIEWRRLVKNPRNPRIPDVLRNFREWEHRKW